MAETEELIDEESLEKEFPEIPIDRVGPLDPDLLLFALPIAMLADLLDIVLELTSIFVIPKIIGMVIDGVIFCVIGGWIYLRTKRIIESREAQKQALQKKLTQKSAKMKQQLTKMITKSPLKRTLFRAGIALIGEFIPLVGLFPFWTISVISTLKEEG